MLRRDAGHCDITTLGANETNGGEDMKYFYTALLSVTVFLNASAFAGTTCYFSGDYIQCSDGVSCHKSAAYTNCTNGVTCNSTDSYMNCTNGVTCTISGTFLNCTNGSSCSVTDTYMNCTTLSPYSN